MRAFTTFAIIVVLATSLAAQSTKPKVAPSIPPSASSAKDAQMWLENANVLTQEIIDDGTANLPKYNDFVMNARLAEVWWKVDQKRARTYIERSYGIANDRTSDTPIEGFKRLFVASTVMQIVTPLDRDHSEAMLDSILTQASRLGPQAKSVEERTARAYFADVIVEMTSQYARVSNARRAKLYRALLNLGGENMSLVLLRDAYRSEPPLGEQLADETVDAVANHRAPPWILADLGSMLLAPAEVNYWAVPVSSQMKERVVQASVISIDESASYGLNEENCRAILSFSMVSQWFPEESKSRVAPVLEECGHLSTELAEATKRGADLEGLLHPGGGDDVLRVAERQTDVQKRSEYKMVAASLISDVDPERALGIEDDLSPEEKEKLPWLEEQRNILETKAIKQIYARRDFAALQHLIDRSPTPSRTALWIAQATIQKDQSYSASLLPTIVDGLGESRLNHSEFYLEVVNFVFKVAKPMTPVVFRDSVKGINSGVEEFIRGQTPHPVKAFKRTSFWWQLEPAKLDPMLDVLDQRVVRLTIDSLKFPMARTSMRLWLLKSELLAYEKASNAKKNSATKSN